jgi:hypothetical protein
MEECLLTIDYEQKYWSLLETYGELLEFLQEKAPLTHQAWSVRLLENTK